LKLVATLPATLGVLGQSRFERAPDGLVTVQVLGFRTVDSPFARDCLNLQDANADDPTQVVVVRRRRLSFVNDRILFLPLPLKESCNDTGCSAADGLTCIGGACVDMSIDSTTLPDYHDDLIFGNTNTCFRTDLCLPEAGGVPVLLDDPDTCTFRAQWPSELGVPVAGDLNVRVFYNTFGTEVLDLDPEGLDERQHDGLSFVDDESDPLSFRLAPNVCETNFKRDKILGLEASALCPTKRPFQPLCDEEPSEDTPDAGGGGSGDELAGLCTVASLSSVESAAYVLMDSSLSMFRYFGEGGLQFAVELPLNNPVARGTRLAFGLLPAEESQCEAEPAANAFASPRIPFGDVSQVRQPIGELLGDASVVRADNPPLLMEAALEGAYSALAALQPTQSTRFNRKALVVIANRDFGGQCPSDGVTPAQRANAAFQNQSIYTYGVVLGDGDDAAAVADATELANQGGTTLFNGVADEAQGAVAVQRILNDLGSCLYEVRSPLTGDVRLPDDAQISYLNPLLPARTRVGIARNPACSEATQDQENGWSQGGDDLVRICGQACLDLRETLDSVSVTHAVQSKVAPPVPLVVTAACPGGGAFD
jgi:hypothetical protein